MHSRAVRYSRCHTVSYTLMYTLFIVYILVLNFIVQVHVTVSHSHRCVHIFVQLHNIVHFICLHYYKKTQYSLFLQYMIQ